MNERLSLKARKEAMALARCPHLGQVATERLAELSELPAPYTTEASLLSDDLKRLKYGLIGQVITDLLETEGPITCNPEEVMSFLDLELKLRQEYRDRLLAYDDPEKMTPLKRLQRIRAEMSPGSHSCAITLMEAGIDTMAIANTRSLRLFSDYLDTIGISGEEKVAVLRRSYNHLIDIAQHDTTQLRGGLDLLSDKTPLEPIYDQEARKVEFRTPIFDQPLPKDTLGRIAIYQPLDMSGGLPVTLSAITNDQEVIGCPVLLKPGQLQRLWNETIDLAIIGGLV